MVWFKVDDNAHSHPKLREAGLAAAGLWALAGSYSAKYGLDGFVPKRFVTELRGTRLAAKLVAEGLWSRATRDGKDGWEFHDWDVYQPSPEDVAADKAARDDAGRSVNAVRQQRYRERQKAKREAERAADRNADRNVTRNADRNARNVTSDVTRYRPTDPDPGVTPNGVTPPTDRIGVTGDVTRDAVTVKAVGRSDGGDSPAESRAKPRPTGSVPKVLAEHGLTRDDATNFLAWLRTNGAQKPNAIVTKLERDGVLDERIDEWRMNADADAKADAAASAPPPGKRTTTHRVRGALDLAARYAAEEAAAGGGPDPERSEVVHLRPPLIEGA